MTKNIRDIEGLTQKELAKYLGVSSITISRWERRVQNPSAKNLKKIIFLEDMIEKELDKPTIWARIIKFLKGE